MTKEISLVWVLVFVGIVGMLVVLILFLRYLVYGLVDKRTLRYQSDLLEKHCEEVQNMYRQTRGWRHD